MRDTIIWRLVGLVRGPDCKEALDRAAKDCCRFIEDSETTVSALVNGYCRLMEWIQTGEPPKRKKHRLPDKLDFRKKSKRGSSSSGGGSATTASQQPKAVAAGSVSKGPSSSSEPAAHTQSSSRWPEQGSDIVRPSFDDPPERESSMQTFPDEAINTGTFPEAIDAKTLGKEDWGTMMNSLQLSEIKEMMKAMNHKIEEVRAQVNLQAQLMLLRDHDWEGQFEYS